MRRSATSRSRSILDSGSSRTRSRSSPSVGAAVLHDARGPARYEPQPSDGLGTRPADWSVVAGRSFRRDSRSTNGVISGTPTTEGAYSFKVQGRASTRRASTHRVLADGSPAAQDHCCEAVRDGAPPDAVGGRSSVQRQAHALRREWHVHVHARSGIAADGAGARRRRDGRRNSTRSGSLPRHAATGRQRGSHGRLRRELRRRRAARGEHARTTARQGRSPVSREGRLDGWRPPAQVEDS